LLAWTIAGSGAVVLLSACGGGSDSSTPDSVANRARRNHGSGGNTSAAASSSTAASSTTAASTGSTPAQSTIGAATQEMQMAHEAKPNGVATSYQWANGPDITNAYPPAGMTAMTGWGDIQFAVGAPQPAGTTTAQLRNFKTYVLTSSGLQLMQSPSALGGGLQNPDFSNDTYYPTQMSSSGGVTSVVLDPSKSFQFFPTTRENIPSGTLGVVTTVEAQISSSTNDPNINKEFILALGADWWTTLTANWDNNKTNPGVGDGRYVFLTTSWQCYTFTSITGESPTVAATPFAC
jgi:hypothetical protein